MKSLFITGTDTDVGKTWITAGLARVFRNMGIDVGIMKPFAAGTTKTDGYKSEDAQILAYAAKISDDEKLVNPQFFSIPASPYTAVKSANSNLKVDVDLILTAFKKLTKQHDMILVEGIGGLMTPILKNYFVANLINDMNLDTIIITRNRIGSLNHIIMTTFLAKKYGIRTLGIIINEIDSDGYDFDILKRDIEDITGFSVIGSLPKFEKFDIDKIAQTLQIQLNLAKVT